MKFLSSYQNKYVKKSIKKRPKNKNSDVLFYIELDGLFFVYLYYSLLHKIAWNGFFDDISSVYSSPRRL